MPAPDRIETPEAFWTAFDSERSLQRHLRVEGHNFQALLSESRRQLALEYLSEPTLEISEIAYLLGYERIPEMGLADYGRVA